MWTWNGRTEATSSSEGVAMQLPGSRMHRFAAATEEKDAVTSAKIAMLPAFMPGGSARVVPEREQWNEVLAVGARGDGWAVWPRSGQRSARAGVHAEPDDTDPAARAGAGVL